MWLKSTGEPVPQHAPNSLGGRVLTAAVAVAVTTVFFIDFCNLIYRCGCRSLWNGAASMCNVHSPFDKHCPWCSIGSSGAFAVWLTIIAVQLYFAVRPRRLRWAARIALTLGTFPVLAGVLAFGIGVSLDYWT